MRYTAEFVFFRNTPFTNFNKTLNFTNDAERDRFFDSGIYSSVNYTSRDFNFVRDRLTLRVPNNEVANHDFWTDFADINYCYFNEKKNGKKTRRYYCQVNRMEYVNNGTVNIYLGIDVLMTFFQGDFSQRVGYVNITRQHLTSATYNNNIYYLGSQDHLQTSPLRSVHQGFMLLAEKDAVSNASKLDDGSYWFATDPEKMWVLFQSSADLSKDFGDIDAPKLKTSGGTIFDKVTSPVDLYMVKGSDANKLFDELGDFPWIEQNIKNIIMIPEDFVPTDKLKDVKPESIDGKGLKKFKNKTQNSISKKIDTSDISFTRDQMFTFLNAYIDNDNKPLFDEPHLFNSGYFAIVANNWIGAPLRIDPEKLPDQSLQWNVKAVFGYDNRISFFPVGYGSDQENLYYDNKVMEGSNAPVRVQVPRGEYLGSSLTFDQWDQMPILIDNYKMTKASTAYDRKLSQENMFSGQLNMAMDPDRSLKDRFFAGMNVVSNLNPKNLMGNAQAEWNYYRQLQAQLNQAKIQRPTETNMTASNAFGLRNATFGVSVKFYSATPKDVMTAYNYHKVTGYKWQKYDRLESVRSMSHINYVQFDGDWVLPGIQPAFMEIAKSLFAAGVSLYHNPSKISNPFNDDPTKNRRVM